MLSSLLLSHHRAKVNLSRISWSVQSAGKATLASVPTAVLVAHPSIIPLPDPPPPFHPGQLVVVVLATSTKGLGKDIIEQRRQTAWESPLILMEMLLWTRWQTFIASSSSSSRSNRLCKQGRYNRHKRPHQCNPHLRHQPNISSNP
jgi:hypothetical protein